MSTKKLGRVMWANGLELNAGPVVHMTKESRIDDDYRTGVKCLILDLSDPAALVEKVAKAAAECALSEVGIEGYSDDECKALTEKLSPVIAKRLGVPAKLLKERKKK